MKRVAIKDSSILIDLVNGDIIEEWFQLKIETWITEAVLSEIQCGAQAERIMVFLEAGAIKVEEIPDANALEWLTEVSHFSKSNQISFADAASIFCAHKKKAWLFTGDGRMRKVANKTGLEVKGLLWVLDSLVKEGLIDEENACSSLTAIRNAGARLPEDECEERLKRWSDNFDWSDF